jgi:serine/threonine protein kinase
VKVLDLGLARFIAQDQPSAEEVTASGQAMGTIDYMAPEQVSDSRHVDIRADIYGLGCTFYKLLTGQVPFGGSDYAGTLDKLLARVRNDPRPIEELRDVPPGVAAILARMLARDPEDRYPTPADLAAAVYPWIGGSDLPGLLARAQRVDPSQLPPEPRTPYRADRPSPVHTSGSLPTAAVAEFRGAWKVWAKTALVTAGILLLLGLVLPRSATAPPKTAPADTQKLPPPAPDVDALRSGEDRSQ